MEKKNVPNLKTYILCFLFIKKSWGPFSITVGSAYLNLTAFGEFTWNEQSFSLFLWIARFTRRRKSRPILLCYKGDNSLVGLLFYWRQYNKLFIIRFSLSDGNSSPNDLTQSSKWYRRGSSSSTTEMKLLLSYRRNKTKLFCSSRRHRREPFGDRHHESLF